MKGTVTENTRKYDEAMGAISAPPFSQKRLVNCHACKRYDNAEHNTENKRMAKHLTGTNKIAGTDKMGNLHRKSHCCRTHYRANKPQRALN